MTKRIMLAAAALAVTATLAVVPAGAAGGPPGSIDIALPAAGAALRGVATITWTYTPGTEVTESSHVQAEAKLDGTTTVVGSAPIFARAIDWDTATFSDAAGYTLKLRVVDGNKQSTREGITIDNTAPNLSASVEPLSCEAPSWCNAAGAAVVVSAADALSGLASDPSGSYPVTDEGARTLSFEATDVAGNSATVDITVQLDRTGPATTIDAGDTPLVVRALDGRITGTAADAHSGVASTALMFTDALGTSTPVQASCTGCVAAATTWSASTVDLLPGLYTVTAASTDAAGNAGPATEPMQVLIV